LHAKRASAAFLACFARSGALRFTGGPVMSRRGDDDFRVRPGSPKNRGQSFVSRVLRQVGKAGGPSAVRRPALAGGRGQRAGRRPGSRLGRGHTAARFAGRLLMRNSRRVTIKTLLVNLRQASPQSVARHLRYIERDGVGRDGEPGRAYGPLADEADLEAFKERSQNDRHQFRFIVSPEDGAELDDLRTYTRHLMSRMEADLGTRLEWVAVNHWNTDNPHTHIVLRGKDDTGEDLIIAGDYIAHGFRHRAAELATEWLGPRTEREIQQSLQREVEQERWTSLDRTLQHEAVEGRVQAQRLAEPRLHRQRELLIGRLQHLQRLGLADEPQPSTWAIHADAEQTLRAMGERGDIIRTMQRAMSGQSREFAVFAPGTEGRTVMGRIAAKGLADELRDRGYLVIDGVDGKAHYVELNARDALEQYPVGAVVEARGSADVRAADRNIAALAADGLYRTEYHLAVAQGQAMPGRDPQEVVTAHVRRLEALRRAGIVERVAEGVWRVPDDLPERGRRYDTQRLAGGVAVDLRSHLPIERQTRAIGATWLDQQLIRGGKDVGTGGFGSEVRQALQRRADFLIDQGFAERRGSRVILARNLLATLRERELERAAKTIATDTGLAYRPVADGERVSGIYRRSVLLASGRFAMIDDGLGFSLVPWRLVIEQRVGRTVVALVHRGSATWELGKTRGHSISE
jgi:type IV secretory pathway VirD2 relaxase